MTRHRARRPRATETPRRARALCACVALCAACDPGAFSRLGAPDAGDGPARRADAEASSAAPPGSAAQDDAGEASPSDEDGGAALDGGVTDLPSDCDVFNPGTAARPRRPLAPVPGVRDATELGVLPVPDTVTERSGGSALPWGERVLWTFPRTRIASDPGRSYVTAAFATRAAPLALDELVDRTTGLPVPLLARSADEADPAFTLTSTGAVSVASERALVFFAKYFIFDLVGVGVGELRAGQGAVERAPALLFEGSTPRFSRGAFVHAGHVYLYSPEGAVARAPLDDARDGATYRAYDASARAWVPELTRASPVLPAGLPDVFSVSYNPFLAAFVLVYSEPGQNVIEMAQAPAPEGPFRSLSSFAVEPSLVPSRRSEQALEQTALRDACGRRLVVSYVRPLEGEDSELGVLVTRSETRLVAVTLGNDGAGL